LSRSGKNLQPSWGQPVNVHTWTAVMPWAGPPGQAARALRNRFTDTDGSLAPLGYPAFHHLTGHQFEGSRTRLVAGKYTPRM
jgi:hypothetical protein